MIFLKGEFDMKKAYDKIADMKDAERFYELWRGISNLFMSFIESILTYFGAYKED